MTPERKSVKIAEPFLTAVHATLGVIVAAALILLVSGWLLDADVDSKRVRALCAHHGGVLRLDEGTTFMQGTSFVTCRDGWFERVDN